MVFLILVPWTNLMQGSAECPRQIEKTYLCTGVSYHTCPQVHSACRVQCPESHALRMYSLYKAEELCKYTVFGDRRETFVKGYVPYVRQPWGEKEWGVSWFLFLVQIWH